jgi:hypothetical protein
MIHFPKPRGFWDYTLFALATTGVLVLLFWAEAGNQISWPDAVLATAAALLFVLAVTLARRGEKAKWIAQPNLHVYLVATLGAFILVFGAIYVDAYLFHRGDITSTRIRHDIGLAVVLIAGTLWTSRRRWGHTRRELS